MGAGTGIPSPVYMEWLLAFQKLHPAVSVDYDYMGGSIAGIEKLTIQAVEFGASDTPMTDQEVAAAEQASDAKVLHIPSVLEGVGVAYNLPEVGNLRLDPDTLAAIFLGHITTWNDPQIAALNPGVTLPSTGITVLYRRGSSLFTLAFTSYLSLVSAEWKSKVGAGKEVKWPVGMGGIGNFIPEYTVTQEPGGIGYVRIAWPLSNGWRPDTGIRVAELMNKSGNFITPTFESTSAAAQGLQFPADLRFSPLLLDSANPQAYPIVTATWILAYDRMRDPAKAALVKAFLTWAHSPAGDVVARDMGFVPIPSDLKSAARAKIEQIGP